jgi:phage terminase small subunit
MPNAADHPNVIPGTKTEGRKHRTKAEIASRRDAAAALARTEPVVLTVPDWLSKGAKTIAKRKIAEIQGLNSPDVLLDPLDMDVFGMYCENSAIYQKLARKNGKKTTDDYKLMLSLTQKIHEGADKLGFTPASRARLIRKRASETPGEEPGKKFD